MCLVFKIAFVSFFCVVMLQDFASSQDPTWFRYYICESDTLRSDSCGGGKYGAPRKGSPHTGVDLACPAGDPVYAPFPGIIGDARPYGNGEPHDIGVLIQGTGEWNDFEVKLFYVTGTLQKGARVAGGSQIGTMFNMASQYRCSMTNHVHVKLSKNGKVIDPTNFIWPWK